MTTNVLYLSEIDVLNHNGGGEFILRDFISKGKQLGYEVTIANPRDNRYEIINRLKVKDFDLLVCSDMWNRPELGSWFVDELIDEIISHQKYATFETGYTGVCSHPQGYNPCSLTKKFHCSNCPTNNALREDFFKEAALNIYLSPLQAEAHFNFYGIKDKAPYVCIPEIDTNMFYNMNIERDIDYIVCGVICQAKGYFDIVEYFHKKSLCDKKIVWVGPSLLGSPAVGEWIQRVPREDMCGFMNRAKNLIGLPVWKEAFGLVYAESALCGCNIIANENCGALSCFEYDQEKLANPSHYKDNYSGLWKTLLNLSR